MTIAEVCKMFNMPPDTLRYYEKVGLIPKVGRTTGGIRNYSETDINWVAFIKCMRGAGVAVESLVRYVKLFSEGDNTTAERKQILCDERNRIAAKVAELTATLDRLNAKIERYEKDVVPVEKELAAMDAQKNSTFAV
jgi:DNA-binding transcriptional MerR regulator